MLRALRLLLLLALSLAPLSAHAAGKNITLGGVDAVYCAPAASATKQPLIFFSHGFRGCATQSAFLMAALAADGYWVFAPNHKDAVCRHLFSAEETRQSLAQLLRPDCGTIRPTPIAAMDIEALFDALAAPMRVLRIKSISRASASSAIPWAGTPCWASRAPGLRGKCRA